MLEPVLNNPWVRAGAVLAALVGVAILAYLLSPVLVPLFFAFLVAYVLDPVVDFFERRKISRTVAIGAIAGLALAFLLAIPLVIVPLTNKDADELTKAAETTAFDREGVSGWIVAQLYKLPLDELVTSLGWDEEYLEMQAGKEAQPESEGAESPKDSTEDAGEDAPAVEEPAESEQEGAEADTSEAGDEAPKDDAVAIGAPPKDLPYDPLAVIAYKIAEMVRGPVVGYLQAHAADIGKWGTSTGASVGQVLASIGRGIVNVLLFLGNFALFAFVATYLLKDYDRIIAAAGELIPRPYYAKTSDIMRRIDGQLKSFIRGQMAVCFCLGVMYAVGLLISGVPFAILLALFGAVASFIPYLGIALTIGPAVILCVLQHGVDWHVAGVAATFIIAQMMEGTVITPKVVGDQVGLNPVWVILAILVFGNALGFLGLLLAVPIAASLKVLIVEGIELYKNSDWYKERTAGA